MGKDIKLPVNPLAAVWNMVAEQGRKIREVWIKTGDDKPSGPEDKKSWAWYESNDPTVF